MKRTRVVAVVRGVSLLFVLTLNTFAAAAEVPANLAAAFQQKFDSLRAPGVVAMIRRGSEAPVVFTRGVAEVAPQRAMSAEDHFRIGSLSKVFVGTAVLLLAGDGKLSLDDPISKYVDGLPNGDRITLRHAGSHRSGLFNHIEARRVKAAFAAEPQRWWTLDELLSASRQAPVYFEPDHSHHYSNANTIVLAMAIEKATSRPWAEVVTERVIKPLGLAKTSIPADNELPTPAAHGYAYGTEDGPFFHRGNVLIDVTQTSPSWWGPAGSMISTAGDLLKAAKPLATGQLLQPEQRQELQRWTPADQQGYDYGFHVERVRELAIGHDGDVPGYQCCMYYLPTADASVVVLTNVYGWSIRDMPASRLFQTVVESSWTTEAAP